MCFCALSYLLFAISILCVFAHCHHIYFFFANSVSCVFCALRPHLLSCNLHFKSFCAFPPPILSCNLPFCELSCTATSSTLLQSSFLRGFVHRHLIYSPTIFFFVSFFSTATSPIIFLCVLCTATTSTFLLQSLFHVCFAHYHLIISLVISESQRSNELHVKCKPSRTSTLSSFHQVSL